MDVVVKPYFRAYALWLEQIHCGMTGGELYNLIEHVMPKTDYHWSLCPGHLTADEEWLSSPVYSDSQELLVSGMLFQLDMIPSVEGYGNTNAESTIALADEALQNRYRPRPRHSGTELQPEGPIYKKNWESVLTLMCFP